MNIVACRVDERLVHGQIMTSWSKHLLLKQIIVVDDQVASDDFMKTVLSMSAPAGIRIEILSVSDAVSRVASDGGDDRTMLLFKGVSAALALARGLKGTPHEMHELNLGNLGSGPGRKELTKRVFLSEEERDKVRGLQGLGVNVFLQMLYTDPAVTVTQGML